MYKRSLLASVAFSIYASGAFAAAKAPEMKIGGYTNFGVVSANQKKKENGKGGSPTHFQHNCSDIYFNVTGQSASGIEYGYVINFETIPGASSHVNKNYVEFTGEFGTIQGGNLKGPEDRLKADGLNLMGGAYSIDGSLTNVYNMSSGVTDGVYPVGYTNRAAKIAFYSPVVNGFQLGVAYTPNTSSWGREAKQNGKNANYPNKGSSGLYYDKTKSPHGFNNFSMGLKYNGESGLWSYGAAIIYITDNARLAKDGNYYQTKIRRTRAYSTSAYVGYDKFKVAAGFIDNRKSRLPVSELQITHKSGTSTTYTGMHEGNAGQAWNLGAKYTVDSYEFAVGYFNSERKTDRTLKASSDVVSLCVDKLAMQGLKFFGEVDLIRSKTNDGAKDIHQNYLNTKGEGDQAIGNNSGTVFVAGTKLSF